MTTNLDLIRKTYPNLGIREDAKVMYIVEFDDLEVKPDPRDPARRIGQVSIMEKQAAAELIQKQVDALQRLLETDYPRPPSALTWPETSQARCTVAGAARRIAGPVCLRPEQATSDDDRVRGHTPG